MVRYIKTYNLPLIIGNGRFRTEIPKSFRETSMRRSIVHAGRRAEVTSRIPDITLYNTEVHVLYSSVSSTFRFGLLVSVCPVGQIFLSKVLSFRGIL